MLSTYFREHFENMPSPENVSPNQVYKLVVDSFRFLIAARLSIHNVPVENLGEDIEEISDVLLRLANYLASYSALVDSLYFRGKKNPSVLKSANFVSAQIFEFLAEYRATTTSSTSQASTSVENAEQELTGFELWSDKSQLWINAVAHYWLTGHDGNAIALLRRYRKSKELLPDQNSSPWLEDNEILQSYAMVVTNIIFTLLEGEFSKVVGLTSPHNESLAVISQHSNKINSFDLALVSILADISDACLLISSAMTTLTTQKQDEKSTWLKLIERAEISARQLQDPVLAWLASLLRRMLREFEKRALLFVKPGTSSSDKWLKYLQSRAEKGRALLWQPHLEALEEDYLNLDTNCVVSMPPGAGKSFIAELRIAATLEAQDQGWVLYLVPTNALARQVESDLKKALSPALIPDVGVKRFVTDVEYNFLVDEQLPERPIGYVAVMTPEKLRLALSISPQSFETCQLCVVDEAHLIGEEKRGALLDLVLSQLRTTYPAISFLLLSAMMSNPEDLSRWLNGKYVFAQWRPTRQAMMLGIPANLLNAPNNQLQQSATSKSWWLTDLYFATVYTDDWVIGGDQAKFTAFDNYAYFKHENGQDKFKATETARHCALALASTGLKTLMFLPHPFVESSAEKIGRELQSDCSSALNLDVWKRLLKRETGEDSPELIERLRQGVCYHKSAMHEEEQRLSEECFVSYDTVKVMIATSTLSHGMNLPVEALIFAGDRRYDDDLDEQIPISAKDFANIAGRAGRPAFASQGLIQVIPNWNTWQAPKAQYKAMRANYLAIGASGFRVGSGLDFLLDQIQQISPTETLVDSASALATAWFGQSGDQALLQNTYAFYLNTEGVDEDIKQQVSNTISTALGNWIREQEQRLPLSDIARETFRRSGLPSRTCRHLYLAAESIFEDYALDIDSHEEQGISFYTWLDILLPLVQSEECSFFFQPRVKIGNKEQRDNMSVVWQYETDALKRWLNGERIAELVTSDFVREKQNNRVRWRDRAVRFTRKTTQQYAYALGSLLLFLECVWREQDPINRDWSHSTSELDINWPPHLLHLPLAVKWGVNTLSALVWQLMGVRFRFANRILGDLYPTSTIDEQAKRRVAKLLYEYKTMYKRDPQLVVGALRTYSQQVALDYPDDLLRDVADACFDV